MADFAVSDEFFDGQTQRAASAAIFGGADVLECMTIARSVKGHDFDGWYEAWNGAAAQAYGIAEAAERAGQSETARLGFLRASTYFRTSGIVFLSAPVDRRLTESLALQRDAFRRALPLMKATVEIVEIPFEDATLPGYYFRAVDDDRKRATLILLNGYDGTVEETYFGNAQAALDRGYDVLAFDGPGQGTVLVEQSVTLRPDWENVLPPVVDWLLTKPGVDPSRIGLIGWSLGGYLAPRAASGEHRLAACVADSGFYDLYDTTVAHIPGLLRNAVNDGNRFETGVLEKIMDSAMKQPTKGWGLRRGLYVNGVNTPTEYLRDAERYTLKGYAEKIACPTLICHGELDDVAASAPQTYAALTCPKEIIEFKATDGAGDHCESGARQLYLAKQFAWLDPILDPRSTR